MMVCSFHCFFGNGFATSWFATKVKVGFFLFLATILRLYKHVPIINDSADKIKMVWGRKRLKAEANNIIRPHY